MSKQGIAHLMVDHSVVKPTDSIRVAALAAPLLVVSPNALANLIDELGDHLSAVRWLQALVEEIGHPIGVNVRIGTGGTSTIFLGPEGWSPERLSGWVGGHHSELERAFGNTAGIEVTGAKR